MVGIELVTDRKEKTPAKAETAILFEKLKGNKAQPPNTINVEKISL
jgi:4-aminobutyrate aminotransferase-like enzyme